MRFRSRERHRAYLSAVFGLVLAPLLLSTSQPVVPVAVVAPRARPAVSLAVTDLPMPSRSASRFSLLELIDPEVIMLEVEAVRAGKSKLRVSGPKGTRVWTASAMSDNNVPAAAARAYRNAARTMAGIDPYCQIPWTLLAGIGRVESDHGRYGGSTLAINGVSHPLIIGVQLDGKGPVAAIRDTDDGKLDKDKVWDRAVGPMQFIPSTWVGAARDGDGDGIESPNDLDDAALAAATYLCSGSGSVLGDDAMSAAIYRYNQDDYYVALVKAFERGYRTGVFIMPPPPVSAEDQRSDRRKKKQAAERDRSGLASDSPTGTKSPGSNTNLETDPEPSGDTSTPSPTPSPKPSPSPTPTPTAPKLTSVTGTFKSCGDPGKWCLGSTPLDLGPVVLTDPAAEDFDDNGTTGTNAHEFAGLSLLRYEVTLLVGLKDNGHAVVYVIDGMDYRFADGTFA